MVGEGEVRSGQIGSFIPQIFDCLLPMLRRCNGKTYKRYLSISQMPASNGTNSPLLDDGRWLDEHFPLHRAVFYNDVRRLKQLLGESAGQASVIDRGDTHGNTATHIACMLGHYECIKILLEHGATIQLSNNLGWFSIHEAISYGDRKTIRLMLTELKKDASKQLKSRLPFLGKHFINLGDFYLETKLELFSWIPFLSRILPSDTFKIYKKGHCLRLDFTLINFKSGTMPKWERGHISLLLDMLATDGPKAMLVDHKKKVYQVLRDKNKNQNLNDDLDLLMTSDIIKTHMSTRPIHFVQAKNIINYPKWEMVGPYKAYLYHIKGMQIVTRKRREHLSKEDLERNRMMQQLFSSGQMPKSVDNSELESENSDGHSSRDNISTDDDSELDLIGSLEPPSRPTLSWHHYLRVPDEQSHLGRPMQTKVNSKDLSGMVAMSTDFPLSLDVVLDILSVLEPMNPTVAKLRSFCALKLPKGFPVRVEIPVVATIQARIIFQGLRWCNGRDAPRFPDEMFRVPGHYREQPDRFKHI